MIQPIDEKQARYRVIKLMTDGKFKEADALLTNYIAVRVIDRVYTDFYSALLTALRELQSSEAPVDNVAPSFQFSTASLVINSGA
mgnify:CR=1 FL=1